MIFVTVGTHEQAFDRLLEEIDNLKKRGVIADNIIIQSGFSDYKSKFCNQFKLISYDQMLLNIKNARIVITHGGPASIFEVLHAKKIPIVVPRQQVFQEHVNNHQVEFTKKISEKMGNIIPVYDINDLEKSIKDYDSITFKMKKNLKSNNEEFNMKLETMCERLFRGGDKN